MAKISTYPINATPTLSDKLIGTDPNDLNITKNYTIAEILALGGSAPLPYKVYTALLTQTDTDAPVATILENTIGDINLIYNSDGNYTINSLGLFTENKTVVFIGNLGDDSASLYRSFITLNSVSDIYLYTFFEGVQSNYVLYKTPIEIRVYN